MSLRQAASRLAGRLGRATQHQQKRFAGGAQALAWE